MIAQFCRRSSYRCFLSKKKSQLRAHEKRDADLHRPGKAKKLLHPNLSAIREIRYYQRGSDLLIPKLAIARQVRSYAQNVSRSVLGRNVSHKLPPNAMVGYMDNSQILEIIVDLGACSRCIKQTMRELVEEGSVCASASQFRWRSDALAALHAATEAYIVTVMSDAILATVHAKRQTTTRDDIQLVRRLRGEESTDRVLRKMRDKTPPRRGCVKAPDARKVAAKRAAQDKKASEAFLKTYRRKK